MNIEKIKQVVDLNLPNEVKENIILSIIAEDKKAIPYLLKILEHERETNKELISDSNLELSRALLVLKDKNLKYNKNIIAEPNWVVGEIIKHFQKWKDHIKCNFKIKELP